MAEIWDWKLGRRLTNPGPGNFPQLVKMKAILFDLDDTLIVDEAVSAETFAVVAGVAAEKHGVEAARFARDAKARARKLWQAGPCHPYCRALGISAFECLWGKFEGETPELTALREWAHEYRRQVFDAALREQELDQADAADGLVREFETTRRKLQRLMPDAREVLARLSSRYRLGLLTNGAPDLQREKFAASGLAEFFRSVAVSGEEGIGKPRPEIFHRLLQRLDCLPGEAAMVGNSLERDIAGARNAGVPAIWLRVAGSEEHAETEPDAVIESLSELPSFLESLEAGNSGRQRVA